MSGRAAAPSVRATVFATVERGTSVRGARRSFAFALAARWALLALCLVLAPASPLHAASAQRDPSAQLWLPTALPSGDPVNDKVWITFYPAVGTVGRAPAIVLLHPLGEQRNTMMRALAHYFAHHGFASATMDLAWHLRRHARHEQPIRHYITPDVDVATQAFGQSISDVSTVVDWLRQQPTVDPDHVGVLGVSLGAIVAHAAMGKDPRLTAGVAILGGGDLPDLYRRSVLFGILYPGRRLRLDPEDVARVAEVDPLTYADRNRPRRVLMIQAARDMLIPPAASVELWNALGRPPIRWLDTNHYGPALASYSIAAASAAYLHGVWSGVGEPHVPHLWAPTIKIGFLGGEDFVFTPGITWQALRFINQPNHMSLLHADLGWSGRGFFVGVAVTLNGFVDVGMARRFGGRDIRPYVSVHLVL